jgi:hypothetical protein
MENKGILNLTCKKTNLGGAKLLFSQNDTRMEKQVERCSPKLFKNSYSIWLFSSEYLKEIHPFIKAPQYFENCRQKISNLRAIREQ